MNWLTYLTPHALSHVATSSVVLVNSGSKGQPIADELAHSMEIAIRERFTVPSSTVTNISRGQAQGKANAEILERSVDIAIEARAA